MKRFVLTMAAAGALASFNGTMALAQEGKIQERRENQQQRIGQGVQNGALTPREAIQLEKKQAQLNKEIHHDRVVNGGNLTNKEKRQINRQQNRMSRQIYNKKHDGPGR